MVVRGGRYELLGAIASGGMATVHLARALGVGGFERFVAVKVMHQNLAEEQEFVAMFLDEARLAARIRHPNVVGTLDVQEDEHGLFLVMEYVEGPSLQNVGRALAKAQAEMPLDIALRIFIDALAGLHAAHELRDADGQLLNLVHRDVSPHNILIGADGVAQITDFGVARAESRLQSTRSGVVKGKVSYMAPEQIRSQPLDRRTDVFAAGALLWELLTNKRRVRGDNDAAMMHVILAGEKETPRDVKPSVPEAISDACMRALSLDAADRFPTAADFAETLEQAATIEGVSIASTRTLAAFIKRLAIERPSPASFSSSTSRRQDLREAGGTPANRTGPQTAATTHASPAEHPVDSTHSAIVGSGARPSRSGSRAAITRWSAIAGAAILLGIAAWLFTLGPLKVSLRGESSSAAANVAGSAAPVAATSDRSSNTPAPPIVTPVIASATSVTTASTAADTAAPTASALPKAKQGAVPVKQDQNPAGFRPKEL